MHTPRTRTSHRPIPFLTRLRLYLTSMGMETVIAFMRGGGCTIKNVLDGRKTHWLMVPVFGKMSTIECVIGPTQFAAILYQFSAAVPHLFTTVSDAINSTGPTHAQWMQAIDLAHSSGASPLACEVAKSTLTAHSAAVRQKNLVMCCKMVLGVVFVLLTLLTCKIPFMPAVYWALLFVEIALAFLLTVMGAGVAKGWQMAGDLRRLSDALNAGGVLPAAAALPLLVGPTIGEAMPQAPWTMPLPTTDPFGVSSVAEHVALLAQLDVKTAGKLTTAGARAGVATELATKSAAQYAQSTLDAVLCFLNVLAFLGYATYPISWFVPESYLIQVLPLWPGHDTAVYYGNFLGDAAWTIEAALALMVPAMLERGASGVVAARRPRGMPAAQPAAYSRARASPESKKAQ